MKNTLKIAAFSVAVLATACGSDEMTDLTPAAKPQAITVAPTLGRQTRADENSILSLRQDPQGFRIWAFTRPDAGASESYFEDGYKVVFRDGAWVYNNGNEKYWPVDKLDFYALYPATPSTGTVKMTADKSPFAEQSVKVIENYEANGSEDLLYAYTAGVSRPADGSVNINFRHALTQIAFRGRKMGNTPVRVTVKGIRVVNIGNKSTFTWGGEATSFAGSKSGSWADPRGNEFFPTTTLSNTGQSNEYTSYTAYKNGKGIEVTSAPSSEMNDMGSLFLIPQLIKGWKTSTDWDSTGSRILIDCEIADATTGVKLWPLKGRSNGEIAVSLPDGSSWDAGKKYTYTLIFGQGAGYDPANPQSPVSTLMPISFSVNVEDFVAGNTPHMK